MSDNTSPHLAKAYDKQVRETLPFYDVLLSEVIGIVKIIKPEVKNWIDTGCGTGNLIDLAIDEFKSTQFYLADPSKEMLDIAMDKNSAHPNVNPIGVYTSQELVKGAVIPDVLTAIQCHHYLVAEERIKALKACYDLLPEGGLFVTSENISPTTPEGIAFAKNKSVSFQITQGRTEEAAISHSSRFGVNYFPITVEKYMELLRECGFKVVEILWVSNTLAGFYCIK